MSVLATSTAFAGSPGITYYGHINHQEAVPTLSGMMLIVLSLLLVIVAIRVANQKSKQASKFFITLLGVTALASGINGVKIISSVEALQPSVSLNDDSAGNHTVNFTSGVLNDVTNTTSLPLGILSIDYESCTPVPRANECLGAPNSTILQPNGSCQIDCRPQQQGCFNDDDCDENEICNSFPGNDFGGQCVNAIVPL